MKVRPISKEGTLWVLRQLRTSSDGLEKGNMAAVAVIFNNIAKVVLQHGSNATIRRKIIQKALSDCSGDGEIVKVLKRILESYKDIKSRPKKIPILGNKALNKDLESLAEELSSSIADANKTVVGYIEQNFTMIQ
ncbi:hypothetical protein BGZ76_007554 [Entomortierella beljakovae]|nr:hypothetical protein BGZ76_007554 [Entomortierella beljakovae]